MARSGGSAGALSSLSSSWLRGTASLVAGSRWRRSQPSPAGSRLRSPGRGYLIAPGTMRIEHSSTCSSGCWGSGSAPGRGSSRSGSPCCSARSRAGRCSGRCCHPCTTTALPVSRACVAPSGSGTSSPSSAISPCRSHFGASAYRGRCSPSCGSSPSCSPIRGAVWPLRSWSSPRSSSSPTIAGRARRRSWRLSFRRRSSSVSHSRSPA